MLDTTDPVRLRLIAGMDDLATIPGVVGATAARGGGTPAAVVDTLLAVNEAVTNIIEHGCVGAAGPLQVKVENNGDALIGRL